MASFTRLTISLVEPDARWVLGSSVKQLPAKDDKDDDVAHACRLGGWVVGRDAPVERVELLQAGSVTHTAAVGSSRPKVAPQFPETPWAATSGFVMRVDALALATSESELRAVLNDGTRVPLAVIRDSSQPLPQADAKHLQPLMVTSLARSGSTWCMRLLAEHPEIVAYRRYPYEMRPALYWTHMLKVLAEAPDRSRAISHPKTFRRDKFAVGANPFLTEVLLEHRNLHEWSEQTYRDNLARFCQDSIESWYRHLAINQEQPSAVYFAEKRHPNEHLDLLWEMYPRTRELFLVRDFRDLATSALAFNAQRGYEGFGRKLVDSDEEFLHSLKRAGDHLLEHWRRRSAQAHHVRYEDLISAPGDTLRAVLTYVGLDAAPATIDGMIERASDESPELRGHQTSGSPEASIGRWRRDLDPSLQTAATDIFSDLLTAFGYDPKS